MTTTDILWGIGNIVIFYFSVALVALTVFYVGFFKWWVRPAGVSIALDRISFSLVVIGVMFVGLFIDPARPFWEAPPDIFTWRPVFRLVIVTLFAGSVTFQFIVAARRWLHTKPIEIDVDPRTRPRTKR